MVFVSRQSAAVYEATTSLLQFVRSLILSETPAPFSAILKRPRLKTRPLTTHNDDTYAPRKMKEGEAMPFARQLEGACAHYPASSTEIEIISS